MHWDLWLIFFVLGVVVPWRGRARLRELLAKPVVEVKERLSLYVSTIAFQWAAAAVCAWRAWVYGFRARDLGLGIHSRVAVFAAAFIGSAVLVTLHWLNLRRVGRAPANARGPLQALAERILPQSRRELVLFLVLALTAGLCEEFLYRGFAMAVLARAGLPTWGVVLASSILFGLAHLYQGRGGFVGTLILGLLFGAARIAYDSLAPVMCWHVAVDAVAGIAGPKYLVPNGIDAPPAE